MIALYTSSSRLWRRAGAVTALATLLFFAGCNGCNSTTPANTAAADPNGPDPAMGNLAGSTGQTGAVLGQSDAYQPQQQGETTAPQQGAPVADDYNATDTSYDQTDPNSEPVATSNQAPPELPEYDQPAAPDPNYLWTPGYWASGDDGYYWVPGEWVPPPYYGALWTPPYWGWCSVHYCFHRGYWGPHVGFYGGVDYGFGYVGFGFFGGYWQGNNFYYNRSVTNVGPSVRNYYQRDVVVNNVHYNAQPSNRVSYNGGHGGVNVQPRPSEVAAMHESHAAPVPAQLATRQQAAKNPQFAYNQNHGKPQTAAFVKPAGTPPHIAPTPANVNVAHQSYSRPIEPAANNRPGQLNHPNRPVPQPQNRPTPQPENRATEPQRAAPQPQRPAPTPRPTPQPERAAPAPRPTPQPQHAAPAPRPTPQPQRAAPAPHPAPQPQRAAPAPRPAAPAPRPAAPAPRPAAPAPRPAAPAPRPAAPAPRPAAPAPHPAAPADEHPR